MTTHFDLQAKSHLINLISLAHVDENLDIAEEAYLQNLAGRHGITPQYLKMISRNEMHREMVIIPENPIDRLRQIFDLVCMMLVDGKLDEREVALCIKMTARLGFGAELVADLVKSIVSASEDGLQPEDIMEEEISIHSRAWLNTQNHNTCCGAAEQRAAGLDPADYLITKDWKTFREQAEPPQTEPVFDKRRPPVARPEP